MSTRALVTGGAGFIGSHTVDALLEGGYDVTVLDILQERVHPQGKPAYLPTEVRFVQGDAADPADLASALAGVDVVVHLAAYQDYMPDFSKFIHTNTESTALLFELHVADPQRFPFQRLVFASSQSVSGEGKYSCRSCQLVFHPAQRLLAALEVGDWDIHCPTCGEVATPELIDEASCNSPQTAYAVSKHAGEKLLAALGRRYGIHTAAMRYTYVQGPRNSIHNAYSGIARRFAMQLLSGLAPTCYEDGAQLRDFVNVTDVARANMLALERDEANGRVFNVGGGVGISVAQFADLMIEAVGIDTAPEFPGLFRLGDTRHTVSDLSEVTSLGWAPEFDVRDNIEQYLGWLTTQSLDLEGFKRAEVELRREQVVRQAERDPA